MSTTTLTLKHRVQLCGAKFWKRAPTPRLEVHTMSITLFRTGCMTWRCQDLRSICVLRTELMQHQKERERNLGGLWATQDMLDTQSNSARWYDKLGGSGATGDSQMGRTREANCTTPLDSRHAFLERCWMETQKQATTMRQIGTLACISPEPHSSIQVRGRTDHTSPRTFMVEICR